MFFEILNKKSVSNYTLEQVIETNKEIKNTEEFESFHAVSLGFSSTNKPFIFKAYLEESTIEGKRNFIEICTFETDKNSYKLDKGLYSNKILYTIVNGQTFSYDLCSSHAWKFNPAIWQKAEEIQPGIYEEIHQEKDSRLDSEWQMFSE